MTVSFHDSGRGVKLYSCIRLNSGRKPRKTSVILAGKYQAHFFMSWAFSALVRARAEETQLKVLLRNSYFVFVQDVDDRIL